MDGIRALFDTLLCPGCGPGLIMAPTRLPEADWPLLAAAFAGHPSARAGDELAVEKDPDVDGLAWVKVRRPGAAP